MRGVYTGDNERKKECRKCFLLLFFYLLQYFFKRDKKRRCVRESSDGKKLDKCKDFFLLVMTECVFIFTTCNVNAISV